MSMTALVHSECGEGALIEDSTYALHCTTCGEEAPSWADIQPEVGEVVFAHPGNGVLYVAQDTTALRAWLALGKRGVKR